jgi:hypothetical protein
MRDGTTFASLDRTRRMSPSTERAPSQRRCVCHHLESPRRSRGRAARKIASRPTASHFALTLLRESRLRERASRCYRRLGVSGRARSSIADGDTIVSPSSSNGEPHALRPNPALGFVRRRRVVLRDLATHPGAGGRRVYPEPSDAPVRRDRRTVVGLALG